MLHINYLICKLTYLLGSSHHKKRNKQIKIQQCMQMKTKVINYNLVNQELYVN